MKKEIVWQLTKEDFEKICDDMLLSDSNKDKVMNSLDGFNIESWYEQIESHIYNTITK